MAPLPALRRSIRWLASLLFVVAMAGCELGGSGGGAGCLRVAQGNFTFPPKRVIDGAFEVRVTQRGFDRITAQIEALVLAFFGADEDGRAIIPLDSLGLGSIGTGFGPFDAQIRDLVLTLDISSLSVRLVPGSNPARLEITVEDAAIGLADGVVAGGVDSVLFSGDLACGLANGPNDRIALVSFELGMSIAIADDGTIDARVLPSSFDIQQMNVEIITDCDLPECLDGRSPGSTAECGECESICPAGNFLAEFLSALRDRFDSLFDGLLDALGDDVANIVLGLLVNGKPLAVEGQMPIGAFLGPTLEWTRSARPLAVFVKPARNGITVSGTSDGLGLDLVFDTGFDANTHPCIGPSGPDPDFVPGPRPIFNGYAEAADGGLVAYDVALGVSDAVVNQALFAAWKSGALCIAATSDDLARISGGSVAIGAPTLDLLLPGYASIVGEAAPVRVAVSPRFDTRPNAVSFGYNADDDVTVAFVDASIGVDAWIGNAWVRVFTLTADLTLGVEVTPADGGNIELRLGALSIDNLAFGAEPLFEGARLDVVAPFVVQLALGFLAERPLSFSLSTGGLLDGTGVQLAPVVVAVGPVGERRDWLGIHLSLEPVGDVDLGVLPLARVQSAPVAVGKRDAAGAFVSIAVPGSELWRARVAGGLWSEAFAGQRMYRFEDPRLATAPRHDITISPLGDASIEHTVTVHIPDVDSPVAEPTPAAPPPARVMHDAGCGGGGTGLTALALLVLVSIAVRLRAAWVLLLVLLGACSSKDGSPARECDGHDQCDDGFYCASGGVCEPTTACEADAACCPGAVCFSGWCRPTVACGPESPCASADAVCEAGQCVPRACGEDADCGRGLRCAAGRCLVSEPCGGACTDAEACDVASGRCLAAAHCGPDACGDAARVAVWTAGPVDPIACEARFSCACATTAAPPPGQPGVEPVVVASPGGPRVLSYDVARKSLALSDEAGVAILVDGANAASPRDVGRGVVAALPREAADPVDVFYQDRQSRALVHARFDPMTATIIARSEPPMGGDAGRFQCLVRVPTSVGPRLLGWAFVSEASDARVARLVRVEALAETPSAPSDWRVTTEVETPLVRRSDKPCDGTCALVETCVFDGGAERCGAVAAIPPPACDACDPRSVCVSFRGNDGAVEDSAAACRERVEPSDLGADGRSKRGDADGPLPTGEGLFVRCVVRNEGQGGVDVIVAWHDADRGAIVVAAVDPDTGLRRQESRITTNAGETPGRPLDVAVTANGRIVVAFGEPATGALYVAEAASAAGPWNTRYLAQGGAFARLSDDGAGGLAIVHGDPATATMQVARRDGSGCWATATVAGATSVDAAVLGAPGELWAAWRELVFEDVGLAAHRLVLTRIEPPRCAN